MRVATPPKIIAVAADRDTTYRSLPIPMIRTKPAGLTAALPRDPLLEHTAAKVCMDQPTTDLVNCLAQGRIGQPYLSCEPRNGLFSGCARSHSVNRPDSLTFAPTIR